MFNELAVYDHHDEVSAEQALAAFAVAILVVRSISIPALLVSGPLFTCSELAIELNKLLYSDLEDESLHVDKDVLAHGMIMFQKVLGNDPGIGVFKWTLGRRYGAEYRPVDIANMSFSQYGLLANLAEQPFGYCFDLTNNSQIPTLLRAISVVKDTLISEFYKKKTKKLQSHSSDQSAVWFQQTTTVTREEIIWSMRKPSFIIKALAPLPPEPTDEESLHKKLVIEVGYSGEFATYRDRFKLESFNCSHHYRDKPAPSFDNRLQWLRESMPTGSYPNARYPKFNY